MVHYNSFLLINPKESDLQLVVKNGGDYYQFSEETSREILESYCWKGMPPIVFATSILADSEDFYFSDLSCHKEYYFQKESKQGKVFPAFVIDGSSEKIKTAIVKGLNGGDILLDMEDYKIENQTRVCI